VGPGRSRLGAVLAGVFLGSLLGVSRVVLVALAAYVATWLARMILVGWIDATSWLLDSESADIAPHSARHVVVALWAKLGISPPGLQERQYERSLGHAALPKRSVLRVKAWAPGTVSITAAFRVGTAGLTSLIYPLSLTSLGDSEKRTDGT
jgi:hypothetical protein